jgi:hypothetical protein
MRPADIPELRDPERTVRFLTVHALRRVRSPGAAVALAEALGDGDPDVRAFAVHGLWHQSNRDLRAAGGKRLVEKLVLLRRVGRSRYLTTTVRGLLRRLTGVDPGGKPELWKRWWEKRKGTRVDLPEGLAPGRRSWREAPKSPFREPFSRAGELLGFLRGLGKERIEVVFLIEARESTARTVDAFRGESPAVGEFLGRFCRSVRFGFVAYGGKRAATAPLRSLGGFAREVTRLGLEHGREPGGGGLLSALDFALKGREMGWKRGGRRIIVIMGRSPPDPGAAGRARRLIQEGRRHGFACSVLFAVPSGGGGDAEAAENTFRELAHAGGGVCIRSEERKHFAGDLAVCSLGCPVQAEELSRLASTFVRIRREE